MMMMMMMLLMLMIMVVVVAYRHPFPTVHTAPIPTQHAPYTAPNIRNDGVNTHLFPRLALRRLRLAPCPPRLAPRYLPRLTLLRLFLPPPFALHALRLAQLLSLRDSHPLRPVASLTPSTRGGGGGGD
jgi:hypothetical protein